MLEEREPSDDLRSARRRLESIEGYQLLEDLSWDRHSQKWIFKFRLTGSYTATDWVAQTTVWYAVLSDLYPFGKLDIYPDANEGIKVTLPHMLYNGKVENRPWTSGNTCIKTSFGIWGKQFFNGEPYDASKRLPWSIRRLQAWVKAAAENALFQNGDPFELPHIRDEQFPIWVFTEDSKSFNLWSQKIVVGGVLHWKRCAFNANIALVTGFELSKKEMLQYEWGSFLQKDNGKESLALWLHVGNIPVIEPWQIPMSWGELYDALGKQGIDLGLWLNQHLVEKKLLGQVRHLSLSFPIPDAFGNTANRLHWLTVELPGLISLKGFRENSPVFFQQQIKQMFRADRALKWLKTENWAKDQITSRGSITGNLSSMSILIVGAGAIGSAVSELLIRLGCDKLMVIDDDNLSVGNYSRHTLTMQDLPHYKSQRLARRLGMIFPYTNISSSDEKLEKALVRDKDFLKDFDLVIDATANDSVLLLLDKSLKEQQCYFASLSTGIDAERLYCYLVKTGQHELAPSFYEAMKPWHEKQQNENPTPIFPLEGVGCWHPVFPARLDDIWSVLAPVIRQIELFLIEDILERLVVVERQPNGDIKIIR